MLTSDNRRWAEHHSADEVARLVSEFEACKLARERWTHEAHLTVGAWYLAQHDVAEAPRLIREGIKRYNQACGVVQTETGGYHGTITLFYVRVISRYLAPVPDGASLGELVGRVLAVCGDRALPFEYYSRARLLSWAARTGWVVPDLKPLD